MQEKTQFLPPWVLYVTEPYTLASYLKLICNAHETIFTGPGTNDYFGRLATKHKILNPPTLSPSDNYSCFMWQTFTR